MTHTMDVGSGWTQQTGTWTISSNTAVQSDNTGLYKVATVDAGTPNCKIHVRIKKLSASGVSYAGIVARFTDINNYWLIVVYWDQNWARITEMVGGVETARTYKVVSMPYQKWIDVDVTCNGDIISATFDGGKGLTYTSSANNTATKFGIFEVRDGSNGACSFDDFQIVNLPIYPWTRQGTVITDVESGTTTALEPTVIYENNAQILSGNVFKMWYTRGWGTNNTCYAESSDGINWTKYISNPVLAGVLRSSVLKVGNTYYLYGTTNDTQINQYTSPDGINWTLANSGVVVRGTTGAWDDTGISNCFVWYEGVSTWKMLYEAYGSDLIWKLGLATSTDGITWTKSGSNPVLTYDGSSGGPYVAKIGSYYYLFIHRASNGQLPTCILRYRSSNLTTWTLYPYMVEIPRVGSGEGEDSLVGQTADPFILIIGNTAYLYFSASSDGSQSSGALHIVLATADSRAVDMY